MQRLVPVLGLIALVQTIAVPPPPGAPRRASDAGDDAERARALLAARCFACHGPDERAREAELRLDTRDGLRGVVVPGDAAASELVARVSAAVDRMPPDEAGDALDADEVALLVRWIDAGAELREHWSFRPLERPDVPTVSDPGWCRTPLDAFVLAELDAHGLRPSPVADRATLLTRVSLDLTGLPPSPERVRAFLADPSDDAYERVVDELLAEPAYGERWASVWLDLARYADSAGYGSDPLRTIWPWRDWLVGALNEDVPFDRFTELVLAGDLVEGADDLTRLATAFHRNTLTNTEGGTDDEEFRIAAVKDRVDTTMQVWMGLTAGCARCHDHKFDPISQREYYDLVDLFNQTADADLDDEAPKLATPSRAEREVYDTALREVRDAEAALQRRHDALVPPLDHAFLMAPDVPLVPESVAFASGGGVSTGTGDDAATIVALSPAAADTLRVRVRWPEDVGRGAESVGLPGISFGLRASASPDLPNGGPGLSPGNGNFVVNELHVRAVEPGPLAAPVRYVTIQLHGERRILSLAEVEVFSGDVDVARGSRASQSSTDFGGAAERAIDGTTSGKYEDGSVTHTRNERDPWFELELREPAVVDRVVVHNRTDGELGRRLAGATIAFFDASGRLLRRSVLAGAERDRAELVVARDHELFLQAPWATVEQEGWPATAAVDGDTATGWGVAPGVGRDQVLRVLTDDLRCLGDEIDVEVVQTFGDLHVAGRVELFANGAFTELGVAAPQFADLQERVDPRPFTAPLAEDHPVRLVRAYRRASEALAAIPATETPVLEELPSYRRRDTFVHVRGDFRSPGEPAHAGVPDAFLFGDEPTDRLELAHWLTDERNPLTARVAANRLFARVFGTGLVTTEEDFGTMGAAPTNQALLDHLACAYRDGGWSTKRFLRELVTSATYRQASRADDASLERDPDGTLLSRMPRVRLEAEMVRDRALAASGLLDRTLGGPPVYPPQPEGLWRAAFNGQRDWPTSTGGDRHRRDLYTFLRRTIPYPTRTVFDGTSRETCTLRRVRTNTPLQALTLLGDPVYVECAQALARAVLAEVPGDDRARLDALLVRALGRSGTPSELDVLGTLLRDARDAFAERRDDALLFATDPLGPLPEGADAVELAATTLAANAVLNLDEFVTKP